MSLPFSVVVVGSIMQDLTFTGPAFPTPGETVLARLRSGQGGKGSNQAIACGRSGVRTLFVGAVGADAFPVRVRAFYRRERLGCRLAVKPRQATGTAVILLNGEGQNMIVVEPGANARLAAADLPAGVLRRARVVVTQLESNLATTARVLRAARRARVLTVLNPAPMRADFPAAMLGDVDVLIPNEAEFAALVRGSARLGQPEFSEARLGALAEADLHALCRGLGVPTLILTLGSKGCFVSRTGGGHFLPAHRGLKVVDTTGAGDAFCGGFAAGMVHFGGDIIAAARWANAVAALSVTRAGAAAAMPRAVAVRRLLAHATDRDGRHGARW